MVQHQQNINDHSTVNSQSATISLLPLKFATACNLSPRFCIFKLYQCPMKLKINKSQTEEDLIKGCKRRDPKAQHAIYERYSGIMLGLCVRYVIDRSDAEDVMINGFVKALDKIDQYQGSGSFEGWLRRIMVNEALAFIRTQKNLLMAVEIEKAEKEPDYRYLNDNLEEADLLAMINKLPDGYRTVFNLYAIEGYSHKEIAEMMGISENTSKSQLSRARAHLQKYLVMQEKQLKRKMLENEKT
jgi:RNA polymerase sigma factor (sigma-70 family)